jgi:hypothetical protein
MRKRHLPVKTWRNGYSLLRALSYPLGWFYYYLSSTKFRVGKRISIFGLTLQNTAEDFSLWLQRLFPAHFLRLSSRWPRSYTWLLSASLKTSFNAILHGRYWVGPCSLFARAPSIVGRLGWFALCKSLIKFGKRSFNGRFAGKMYLCETKTHKARSFDAVRKQPVR